MKRGRGREKVMKKKMDEEVKVEESVPVERATN